MHDIPSNRTYSLTKQEDLPDIDARFTLHFTTHDEKTAQLLSTTHLQGTLLDILAKLIQSYRKVLWMTARAHRKISMLEKQLKEK